MVLLPGRGRDRIDARGVSKGLVFTHEARGGDLREIVIAQGFDSIYRLNCFADGVGLLLGALLFGLGVHGLCTLPSARER